MLEISLDRVKELGFEPAVGVYQEADQVVLELYKSLDVVRPEWRPQIERRLMWLAESISKAAKFIPYKPRRNEDGSVDWDSVPVGESIWVTSKTGGGHVLITKLPDNTAVLSDHMARKKTRNAPSQEPFDPTKEGPGEGEEKPEKKEPKGKDFETEAAARRHMRFPMTKPSLGKEGEKELERRAAVKKEDAPKRKVATQIRKEARAEITQGKKRFMEAVGVTSTLNKSEAAEVAKVAQEHFTSLGLDSEQATRVSRIVQRAVQREVRKLNDENGAKRIRALQKARADRKVRGYGGEAEKPDPDSEYSLEREKGVTPTGKPLLPSEGSEYAYGVPEFPYVPEMADEVGIEQYKLTMPTLTKAEIEALPDEQLSHKIQTEFREQRIKQEEGPAEGSVEEQSDPKLVRVEGDDLTITAGESPESRKEFEAVLRDEEKGEAALKHFEEYLAKTYQLKEVEKTIRKLGASKFASPVILNDLRMELGKQPSDEELEQLSTAYAERLIGQDSGASFYEAVMPHWNDEVGNTLAQPTIEGASSALSALMQSYEMRDISKRFDAARAVETMGPEAAARMLALRARESLSKKDFESFLRTVREYNAKNLIRTEEKALAKHEHLEHDMRVIEDSIKAGRTGEVTGQIYIAKNLERQRRNLGVAMGSMSASAAFYDALDRVGRKSATTRLSLAVGDSHIALESKLAQLNFARGSQEPDGTWNITTSRGAVAGYVEKDPHQGYLIHTSADRVKGFVKEIEISKAKADKWEAIKNDTSGTNADGNVEGYTSPGVKTHFEDGTPILFRQAQRNDVEWLKDSGGGVIARTTGAGKTLTSLATMASNIADNPNYKGMIAVPTGNLDQWEAEARKFTDLDIVKMPVKSSYPQREEIYRNLKPGQVVLVGHSHFTIQDANLLESVDSDTWENEFSFNGIHIDEPQQMTTKGGKTGAGAKRIMRLPAQHKVAMTATPTKKGFGELHDLVSWTSGKGAMGQRAPYLRSYAGFGEGTNAQDEALKTMIANELSPHVSGGITGDMPFPVNHKFIDVQQTGSQTDKAREIEQTVNKRVKERVAFYEARPMKMDRLVARTKGRWRQGIRDEVFKEVSKEHSLNLQNGDHEVNQKTREFVKEVMDLRKGGHKKHLVFVDSAAQRKTIQDALVDAGYMKVTKGKQIFFISRESDKKRRSPEQIEANKDQWRASPGESFLFFDKESAVGHNLQEASAMHFMGLPEDGGDWGQALGRARRTHPEDQRTSLEIRHYGYNDSPFENQRRDELDTHAKIVSATAPDIGQNFKEMARF